MSSSDQPRSQHRPGEVAATSPSDDAGTGDPGDAAFPPAGVGAGPRGSGRSIGGNLGGGPSSPGHGFRLDEPSGDRGGSPSESMSIKSELGSSRRPSPSSSARSSFSQHTPPAPPVGYNPPPAAHPLSPPSPVAKLSPFTPGEPFGSNIAASGNELGGAFSWVGPGTQDTSRRSSSGQGSPGVSEEGVSPSASYIHSPGGALGGSMKGTPPTTRKSSAGSNNSASAAGRGNASTTGANRSNASSPHSSVSSITGLPGRRVSGGSPGVAGSMVRSGSSPIVPVQESIDSVGMRMSPIMKTATTTTTHHHHQHQQQGHVHHMSQDPGTAEREKASDQLKSAREVLNVGRANSNMANSGQLDRENEARGSASSQGSTSSTADSWNEGAVQKAQGSIMSIPQQPSPGSMRRSSSDDGRSALSPIRSHQQRRESSSSSSSSSRPGSSPLDTFVPTGVVAPSTLLGVEPTVTSPIRYSPMSPGPIEAEQQEWLADAGSGGSSLSHRRSGSRAAELGRWSTAREARQASPSRGLASPTIPTLYRSLSHESHRPGRSQTSDGAVGHVNMWDSVWPDPSSKAVDPVTALPVSLSGMASPSLTPLVPPLVMHGRSMSASIPITPGNPQHGADVGKYVGQGRRDSNAALFGRPSSGSMQSKTGSPVSPPGSPMTSMKSPARSLPSYRHAKKSTGSMRSNASANSDRGDSPFNAQDLPAFSAPRGPGSPRQIPTVMNRFFEEFNPPNLVFTQPTPPPGAHAHIDGRGDDEVPVLAHREPHTLEGSPPLALPPAVASPNLAPSVSPPISSDPLSDDKPSGSHMSFPAPSGRPVPPPFRRAISHVNAPSPTPMPAPTYRVRSFSGSSSQLTRPVLTSRNSGSRGQALGSGPSSPALATQPISPHQAPAPELEKVEPLASVPSKQPSPLRSSPSDSEPHTESPLKTSPSAEQGSSPDHVSPASDVDADADPSSMSEHDASHELDPSREEGYFQDELAFQPEHGNEDDSAVLDTPLPVPPSGNDSDEVMAAPTDSLPADVAFEDEGLLTLERIFLLSKSEHGFHRAYIARTLGDLLEDTDPCEAVEYVIPLLTGLALDEDESVKEAFASQLHRILWYFFTACDLVGEEDEISASEDPTTDPVFTVTSKGVRAVRRSNTATDHPGNPSAFRGTPGSGSSGSANLSSEGSSGGASLESRKASTVSSAVQTVLTPSSAGTPSSVATTATSDSVHASAMHDKAHFTDPFIDKRAETDNGPVVERPVIPVHTFTPLIGSLLLSQNSLVADPSRAAVVAILAKLRKASNPVLDEWTEERPEEVRLSYMAQTGSHSHEFPIFSVASRRMVQKELLEGIVFGIGRLDGERSETSRKDSYGSDIQVSHKIQEDAHAALEELDPAEAEAAFLKQQLAQEAILGRAISMNLIASISEFLHPHEVTRYDLVTEVARTLDDEPGVKAEAALALAYLAKLAPQDNLELMLSIFEHFVEDETESVRQSACLCLPALSKRIEDLDDRRSYTVRAFEALLMSGDLVEYTLLEIIGEIIHIFQDDPEGPPVQLLEVFYSQAPLSQDATEEEPVREFDNLDRAIVSAFNLPAVCLALGSERWQELRPTYRALCNINHPRIVASLSASIHELAKILGPEITAADLLPSFDEYLAGSDDGKTKVLAGLPTFVSNLPLEQSISVLGELSTMWEAGSLPNWHHRESLASHFAALLRHMASEQTTQPVLDLVRLGLFDTFHAIREATIANMPACYEAVKDDKVSRELVLGLMQDLAVSGNFKARRTYIACIQAFVQQQADIALFEKHFLDDLAVLSDDLLDVRIMVAKCLGPICARDGLYPHSPLRPLRLNEIIERLSNDESNYVRDPVAAIAVRPRIRPSATSDVWMTGPYITTPGSTGSHPSRGSPQDRRSSSASMLIRADSETTIKAATEQSPTGDKRDEAGTQSAPSELMYVPWESPDPTLNGSLRRVSMQEAQRILGVQAEPVKVGMKDPFSATFGRAVAEAQFEANSDRVIKRL